MTRHPFFRRLFPPLLMGLPISLGAQWTAFNDHAPGGGTHVNATRYHVFANGYPASGLLRNIYAGTNLAVTLSITRSASGVAANSIGGTMNASSPLFSVFGGYVDFAGTPDPQAEVSGSGVVTYTFSNLDPAKRYRFHGSAVRGGPDYTNRWVQCEIVGALAYTNLHTSHVLTSAQVPGSLTAAQAALNSGANHTASTGDYVAWDNIQPASNGSFSITCRQYTGPVPGGSSAGSKGYALTGVRLEEISAEEIPVAIITQPRDLTVFEGQQAAFSVAATGNPVFYQWFRDEEPIPGATSASHVISPVKSLDAGTFYVVVSNRLGSVTTTGATLRVVVPQIIEWGRDDYAQVDVPFTLSNVVMMAPGSWHGLALQTDGRIIGWGRNDNGQINVPEAAQHPAAIAAGFYFSAALMPDRTVRCWGDNLWGQCNVPTSLTNAVMIAPGYDHILALRANGTVAAWGRNNNGQINVPTGLSNVVRICAGGYQSLALRADGTVMAWGYYDRRGAVYVPPGLTSVVALAAANLHTMALKADGRVVAWGPNDYGQTNVPTGLSNVVAIAAGNGYDASHSLALTAEGRVFAWGYNNNGQSTLPASLPDAVAIGASEYYSAVLNRRNASTPQPIMVGPPFVMAVLGWPVHQRFAARNAPVQFQVDGLPAGVEFDPATGLLSGWPSDAGEFAASLSASNAWGVARHNFTLIVVANPSAPVIREQPASQTVIAGQAASLQVDAKSALPLRYQWQCNGATLPEQTNAVLTLDPAELASAGTYRVFVSSSGGSLWSEPAILTVVPALRFQTGTWRCDPTNGAWMATLTGLSGLDAVVVEASTNLLHWQPLFTNAVTLDWMDIRDPEAKDWPMRFYRLIGQPPAP